MHDEFDRQVRTVLGFAPALQAYVDPLHRLLDDLPVTGAERNPFVLVVTSALLPRSPHRTDLPDSRRVAGPHQQDS